MDGLEPAMTSRLPRRRRLYLMRHGSVDYFLPDGTPVPPDTVALNAAGRMQADAAGTLFGQTGVRFDRVWASGLPRTVETDSSCPSPSTRRCKRSAQAAWPTSRASACATPSWAPFKA
jgi:probable phosphoglycerate mutase